MKAPVNPARRDIRLRRALDGSIERELPDGTWKSTGLSRNAVLSNAARGTLDALLATWLSAEEVEDLAWDLRLSEQRTIGRNLYQSLFSPGGLGDPGRWLHFVPDVSLVSGAEREEFLDLFTRVPWAFLTRQDSNNASFLMLDRNEPVSITIDAAPDRGNANWFDEIKFPYRPRILLVIPHVTDEQHPTFGNEHEAELREALKSDDASTHGTIQFARTFSQFRDKLKEHRPHVVYFYGHGLSEGHGTEFQFEGAAGEAQWRDFDEIYAEIQPLMHSTQFPPVIWINACQGAASEQESALRVLAPVSCCVIATRTIIAVDDSRALARTALPLIVGGRAPNSAIRQAMHESPLTVRSARWATTIVAIQYGLWSTSSPDQRSDFEDFDFDSVGDFPRVLDRKEPLNNISSFIKNRICLPEEKPTATLWHGDADQGLGVFEARIAELVRDIFPDRHVATRYVELQADIAPSDPDALEEHFRESIFYGLSESRKALDDKRLVDSKRIRDYVRDAFGDRALVVLLHAPLFAAQIPLVRNYLVFWDDHFSALAQPGQQIMLGFGFFGTGSPDLPLESMHALGPVPPRELAEHMWAFRDFYSLPRDRDKVSTLAQSYVDQCDGRFDAIRLKLEQRAGFRRR